ncbi:FG-GAP repeat protein [candidate division KSB1 bacterium]|nr:FG-GAP repeat protein [candidate division KSB1 bacterium]
MKTYSVSFFILLLSTAHVYAQVSNQNNATQSNFDRNRSTSGIQRHIAPERSQYEPAITISASIQAELADWDLRDKTQFGQFTVEANNSDVEEAGFQVSSGDINGDGFDDFIISSASTTALGRAYCGSVYIFYGPRTLNSTIHFADADVKMYGPLSGDIQGLAVGDVNGDGYDDVVAGAAGPDVVYLLHGKANLASTIDLSVDYDCRLNGISGEQTGSSLSIGDINNDGLDDILAAAPFGGGPSGSRPDCGSYFIALGRVQWTKNINFSDQIVIYGVDSGDGISDDKYYPGMQIVTGDLNNDGFDDVLIGAPGGDGPNNTRSNCGESYVILGKAELPQKIDLRYNADLTCYGVDANDHCVRLGSGDVNGDGYDDLLIGARDADGKDNNYQDAGEIYIVYGRDSFPLAKDMRTEADVTIYGAESGDILGRMVAQDVNGDGVSDLLIGAPDADGPNNSRRDCGEAYLLYGYNLPPVIELSSYPHHIINGVDNYDALTAYGAIALADFDNDQVFDLLIGAYNAEGVNNSYLYAGEAYAVSGSELIKYDKDVAVVKILQPAGKVFRGTSIPPKAIVKNLGQHTETFTVMFSIDTLYAETIQWTLAKGEVDTVSFPNWLATPIGKYKTSCEAILTGDENSTNDKKTGVVQVEGSSNYRADVAVLEIVQPPARVYQGTVVKPQAIVLNAGTETSTFPVTFRIGSSYAATVEMTLQAGQSDTVTFSDWHALQLGTFPTKCTAVLNDDDFPENNVKIGEVVVETSTIIPPDVAVVEIIQPKGDILQGSIIAPRAVIANLGDDTETFPLSFQIGSVYSQTLSRTLVAGQIDTVTFPDWTAADVGTFVATCSTALAADENPVNDSKSVTITVKQSNPEIFDIAVIEIIQPTGTVLQDSKIIPRAIVKNLGTQPSTFPVIFEISTSYIDTVQSTLAVGQTDTISFNEWTASLVGTFIAHCSANFAEDVQKENNEVASIIIVVPAGGENRDVAVLGIIQPNGSVMFGSSIPPKAIIGNLSFQAESFSVSFEINSLYAETVQLSLEAGQIDTVTFPAWSASTIGTFPTSCVASFGADEDLSNNEKTGSVTVKSPFVHYVDVGVVEIVQPHGTIAHGSVIPPKAVIANLGTQAANFFVRFSIDTLYSRTVQLSLETAQMYTVSFPAWTADKTGIFPLNCTVILEDDENQANDIISDIVVVTPDVGNIADVAVIELIKPTGKINQDANVRPQASIANLGTQSASFQVTFSIGTTYSQTLDRILEKGEIDTVEFPQWSAQDVGTFNTNCVIVFADDENSNNDQKTGTVTVTSIVSQVIDVSVVKIIQPAGHVLQESTIEPRAVVTNLGTQAAEFPVTFVIDTSYSVVTQVTLQANQTDTVVFTAWSALTAGTFITRCSATLADDENPANNFKTGIVVVDPSQHAGVDVAVVEIVQPTGKVPKDAVIGPQAIITNSGSLSANFPVTFTIDTLYSSIMSMSLGAGEMQTIDFPNWTAVKIGTYETTCSITLANDINPANNQKTGTVTVVEPHSDKVVVRPNPFTPNDDGYNDAVVFLISEFVENQGSILIFDVNGRKIKEIRNTNSWDGKDDHGIIALPGAYYYIARLQDKVVAKGIIGLAR